MYVQSHLLQNCRMRERLNDYAAEDFKNKCVKNENFTFSNKILLPEPKCFQNASQVGKGLVEELLPIHVINSMIKFT